MSVLIKSMKMPGVCHDCRFAFYGTGGRWWCAAEGSGRTIEAECAGFNSNSSPDWCPLVEIPTPHGRLIDGDKLTGEQYKEGNLMVVEMDAIEDAPTVIEAED